VVLLDLNTFTDSKLPFVPFGNYSWVSAPSLCPLLTPSILAGFQEGRSVAYMYNPTRDGNRPVVYSVIDKHSDNYIVIKYTQSMGHCHVDISMAIESSAHRAFLQVIVYATIRQCRTRTIPGSDASRSSGSTAWRLASPSSLRHTPTSSDNKPSHSYFISSRRKMTSRRYGYYDGLDIAFRSAECSKSSL